MMIFCGFCGKQKQSKLSGENTVEHYRLENLVKKLSIFNFTWCVVGYARYQLQINRTDTRCWREAQLQQEVMGVPMLYGICTHK